MIPSRLAAATLAGLALGALSLAPGTAPAADAVPVLSLGVAADFARGEASAVRGAPERVGPSRSGAASGALCFGFVQHLDDRLWSEGTSFDGAGGEPVYRCAGS